MRALTAVLLIGLAVVSGSAGTEAALRAERVAALTEGLTAPTAVDVAADRIAVLEPYRDRLVVYTADGRLTARIDLSGNAVGLARLPGGEYALCDRGTGGVLFVDAAMGVVRRPGEGLALTDPLDLGFFDGALQVLDAGAVEIVTLDEAGRVAERRPLVDGEGKPLSYPSSLTMHDGETFVLDQPASRIHVYDREGAHRRAFCSFGAGDAEVTRGGCLRADRRGLLYLADRFQGRVAVFTVQGEFLGHLDPRASGGDPLEVPVGIAVDDEGLLYVASAEAGRVDLFAVDLETSGLPVVTAVGPTGDGVSRDDLAFVAEAFLSPAPGAPVLMDFRLWETAAPAIPVAEAEGVSAGPEGTPAEGAATFRAVWRPEIALRPGTDYLWSARVRVGAREGMWSAPWSFTTAPAPRVFRLEPNRPNPFSSATTMVFSVPEAVDARLAVYDLMGRQVWSRELHNLTPGTHEEVWTGIDDRGRPAPPGVYFCRLTAGGRTETRKMVLARGKR